MQPLFLFLLLCVVFYSLPAVLHAMQHRWSLAPLYALLGFTATAMVFVTDTKIAFNIGNLRFLAGSSVFFVSLLLTVFIIYAFESIQAARLAMILALSVSVVVPAFRWFLLTAPGFTGPGEGSPSAMEPLRTYAASTLSMAASFFVMVVLWQSFRNRFSHWPLTVQVFLTLFLTFIFDALAFVSAAFSGTPDYENILGGHLLNRVLLTFAASPVLALYFGWRQRHRNDVMPERGLLAILRSGLKAESDLGEARREIALRKEVEARLRRSEARYRAVFYHSPVGILHFDNDGIVRDCNHRLAEIIGTVRENLIGFNMLEQLQNAKMRDAVQNALSKETGFFNDYYETVTSGRKLWLRCQLRSLRNENGEMIGGVGIFDDLTEQKKTQESLRASEEMFRSISASAHDGIIMINNQGRVSFWNEAAESILGFSQSEIIGLPLHEFVVPPEQKRLVDQSFAHFAKHGQGDILGRVYETEGRRRDGKLIPLELSVSPALLQGEWCAVGVVRDISERKEAEEALHRRDAILEAVNYAAQRFLEKGPPFQEVQEVLHQLGKATEVSRVYVFTNHRQASGQLLMRQSWEWCAAGIEPQIDNPELQDISFEESGFQRWAEVLSRDEVVYGDVEHLPDDEQATLKAQGILSIVVTPILVSGNFWGFIGFDECSQTRQWSPIEIDALQAAGRSLGLAIARNQAEQSVRESEERLDLALRGAAMGTWNWNIQTNQVDFNDSWAQMLGYALDEIEKDLKTWENALHPDDKESTIASVQAHLQGEVPKYESEHRLRTKSGDYIWVLDSGRIVERDAKGEPVRMAGTHFDITRRKAVEAELQEARRKEQETESRIEEVLLRGHIPEDIEGGEIAALSEPSQHMDGDFYDFFSHSKRCFDVLVGDVMGKGIQAALVGAGAKSHFLRVLSLARAYTPDNSFPDIVNIVSKVHEELAPQLVELERFITMVYARIDIEHGRLDFIDCGHMRTLVYRSANQECEFLEGENMPIGFVSSEKLMRVSAEIEEGDLIFFYSDGVTEAMNSAGEYFDENRLAAYIKMHHRLSPNALVHALKGSVAEFAGKQQFHDDFTCIAVRIGQSNCSKASIVLDSDLREMSKMRKFLQSMTENFKDASWNPERTGLLLLSTQEVLVNIIEHGLHNAPGHPIEIVAEWDPDHLTLNIRHEGRAFDPSQVALPSIDDLMADKFSEHGRGLFIIRESTDSYTSGQVHPNRACTTLVWHLHDEQI